jgi:hypothetical protein
VARERAEAQQSYRLRKEMREREAKALRPAQGGAAQIAAATGAGIAVLPPTRGAAGHRHGERPCLTASTPWPPPGTPSTGQSAALLQVLTPHHPIPRSRVRPGEAARLRKEIREREAAQLAVERDGAESIDARVNAVPATGHGREPDQNTTHTRHDTAPASR